MPVEPVTGLEIYGPVNEKTAVRYTATLTDSTGALIGELTSLHVEVFDLLSRSILRPRESVLSSYSDGLLVLDLTPQDSAMVDERRDLEDHIVRIDYEYDGQEGHHAIILRVRNLWRLG